MGLCDVEKATQYGSEQEAAQYGSEQDLDSAVCFDLRRISWVRLIQTTLPLT